MDTYTNIRIDSSYDGFVKGGGEILYYLNLKDTTTDTIDWNLLLSFQLVFYAKVVLTILILVLGLLLYFRLYNIKVKNYKGISSSLNNLKARRKRDNYVMRSTYLLNRITNLVEHTCFKTSGNTDRLSYELKRAHWTMPGGNVVLTAEQYNAIMKCIFFILASFSLFIGIFINNILGLMLFISSLVGCFVVTKQVLSSIVKDKDKDIQIHFSDLYFMVHYVLLSNGKAPLINIFSSYYRNVENKNMKAFVKDCIDAFDVYGEYEGSMVISNDYREIYEVQKLMKLIRQFNNGGDIYQDLIGFRAELIESKKYMLRKFTEKLAARAQTAIGAVFILVGQTVIGVTFIYLEDIFAGF